MKVAHKVVWTREKISDYWNVFGNIQPKAPWFSVKAADFLVKEIRKLLANNFPKKEKLLFLDMGTGSGDFIGKVVKELNIEGYGIDLSPERIKNAQVKYPKINFSVGSLTESNMPDNKFDMLISTQTIEHLLNEDLLPAFKEMARILKVGGLMILTTRFEEDINSGLKVCPDCHAIYLHSQHLQSFSIESLSNLLKSVNCTPLIVERSRCRSNFNELLPRKLRFLNFVLYPIFSKYLDRKIGKYIFVVAQKKA